MHSPLVAAINLHDKPQLAATSRNVHEGMDRFLLPNHWSLHIYRYYARLIVGGEILDIYPGCATLVPPNTIIEYHYRGVSHHIFAHFTVPSARPEMPVTELPIAHNLQGNFRRFEQQMEAIAALLPVNRVRAEIKFWDLLWEIAGQEQNHFPQQHPSLEKALSLIELRLSEEISVTSLAREVGVSHNHLTRLFRQATGTTVVAYVRHRRALHAKHLLEHTTMPLKLIATQVHIGDLQSFSALIKKETGQPPRYWRGQSE